MQDAFNLAWKIAFAVKGYAGEGLLESYSDERAPVGKQIVARANQSRKDYAGAAGVVRPRRRRPGHAGLTKLKAPSPGRRSATRAPVRGAGAEEHRVQRPRHRAQPALHLHRRPSPDATVGEEEWPRHPELYLQATTRPGAKLPHAWLVGTDGRRVSTLDVTGKGQMTLLTGIGGRPGRTPPTNSTCRSSRPSSSAARRPRPVRLLAADPRGPRSRRHPRAPRRLHRLAPQRRGLGHRRGHGPARGRTLHRPRPPEPHGEIHAPARRRSTAPRGPSHHRPAPSRTPRPTDTHSTRPTKESSHD